MNPNSAAYYLLAVAYYQMEDFARALPPAQKAIELAEMPQESWLQLLLALYIQKEQFNDAIPLLVRLVETAPDKKTYWMQLSSIYGQVEDYPNALAIMQLAYDAGLVTEDAEIRRLADLLLFNDVPYRGGQVLEDAIQKGAVTLDDKVYEKLANCWVAAGELDKAIEPLHEVASSRARGRCSSVSARSTSSARIGKLPKQRSSAASAKASSRIPAAAQLLMGIAFFNEKKLADARPWFERAAKVEKHRSIAETYLQIIDAQTESAPA